MKNSYVHRGTVDSYCMGADAAMVLSGLGIDERIESVPNRAVGAFLVLVHEARVPNDIQRKKRGEASFQSSTLTSGIITLQLKNGQ
jgi:hypothetical protein